MKIKVPIKCKILTTKGLESVSNCEGDAVCIPFTHTISAERLSFGHYKLEYETMPLHITKTDKPVNTIDFYPPQSNIPCMLDTHTLLFSILIPTHKHYKRVFSESFLTTPLELCILPNLEVVNIKMLKESGPFTIYSHEHKLYNKAINFIFECINLLQNIINNKYKITHIQDTSIDPNFIIQTQIFKNLVYASMRFKNFDATMLNTSTVYKYDKTSRVIVKELNISQYSKEELEYIEYLSLRTGLNLYKGNESLLYTSWGILREGLYNTKVVDAQNAKKELYTERKIFKQIDELYGSKGEPSIKPSYISWIWKSTHFKNYDGIYSSVVPMLIDSSMDLLPLSYKLKSQNNLFVYTRCPFTVFTKLYNSVNTQKEWVEIYTPEKTILQIYYPNGIMLPITNY